MGHNNSLTTISVLSYGYGDFGVFFVCMLVPQNALDQTLVVVPKKKPAKKPAIQDVAMCYSFLDHSVRVGLFGYDRKVGRIGFSYPMILSRLERMRSLDSKLLTSPIFPVTLLCCLGLGPNLVSRSVRTGMWVTPQPSVG